ncbi:MAG: site-specific integrase [Bradymonadales bacterium]|nr:MAG: site-specific integrase [Bradymonadales bacterium]
MPIKKVLTKNKCTRWEVVVYTGGRGSKRIVRRFERKSDAEAFLQNYRTRKNELKRGHPDVRDFEETTFKEEAEYWISQRRHTLSPGHLKRAEGVFREWLPRLGNLRPNRITPNLLTTLQAEQVALGLSTTTVNRKIEIITSVLNLAVRHRRIPYNPASGYQKLRIERAETTCWEIEEAESFLSFANSKYPKGSSDRWKYVVYLLTINTGLRAGEIWGLRRHDLVQGDEIILIQRQFDRLQRGYRATKAKRNRRVPCNDELKQELLSLIEIQKKLPDEALFQSEASKPMNHDNFRKRVFKADLEEWGGRKIRFHDLRHVALTLMVASGVDLRTVQDIAGHQDIKTTMDYTHRVAEKIKEVARTFSIKPKEVSLPKKVSNLRLVICND